MHIFKMIAMYTRHYLDIDLRTSYMLLVFPRMVMCALSFGNDWCVYKISQAYKLKSDIRLLALASSYVILTFGIRTFSNSVEMLLCSVLIYLVSDCMCHSNTVIYQKEFLEEKYREANRIRDRVKFFKMKSSLPGHSFNQCMQISTLCVIGVFNRPTFLAFGLPIVFFWMLRGMGTKSVSFVDFNLRSVHLIY